MKTQDRNLDFARNVRAKQPGSLKRRTDAIANVPSTIARSLSIKFVSDLQLHDRSAEALENTCARKSSVHWGCECHFIFLILKS